MGQAGREKSGTSLWIILSLFLISPEIKFLSLAFRICLNYKTYLSKLKKIFPNRKMYLSKLQNVIILIAFFWVKIANYILPNIEIYLSRQQNQMYLSKFKNVFVQGDQGTRVT